MKGPSLTARRVAERRAAHQLLDTPLVLADPLAVAIVGVTSDENGEALLAREQGRLSRVMRAFMAVRARVAEDEAARQVALGLTQYVVLGAGLDTFAYRNPFAGRLHVFEVDQPSTQAWKRERLAAAGLEPPTSATLVTVDFEHDDLFACLRGAGWDWSRPTLFVWLGVTMYLEPETVRALLRAVGGLARGSGIVFDYAIAPHLLTPFERGVYEAFAQRVQAAGEPWICAFEPEALASDLRACSFTTIEDLDGAALNERYFQNRSDGLRVGTLAHVVSASNR
jgi:methyltransferase (TIGR00027 family)